jgi:GNAT superfamily N-acetyltransferase
MATRAATGKLNGPAKPGPLRIVPLRPARMDDLSKVTSGTWGSQCWCMHPRLNAKLRRELPKVRDGSGGRRTAMTALAAKRRAPGLLAYQDGEVVGWVAVAPRPELIQVDASKATPRVDDARVWVIPCITVRRRARGQGVAQALIRAAVEYAAKNGAPAVEAYPRASSERVHDDFAFIGTEALFRKAGFRRIRGVLRDLPRGWTPRVTMRATCTSKTSPRPRARSASG